MGCAPSSELDSLSKETDQWIEAEENFNAVLKTYNNSLDPQAIKNAIQIFGDISAIIYPGLVFIWRTYPFVGPMIAVSLQFCTTVREFNEAVSGTQAFVNSSKSLKAIAEEMKDFLLWMKQIGPCMEYLNGNEVFKDCLKKLLSYLTKVNLALANWQKKIVNDYYNPTATDYTLLSNISNEIGKIRSDAELNALLEIFKRYSPKESSISLESAFKDSIFNCFCDDITSLSHRFSPGSRKWMHEAVRIWIENNDSKLFLITTKSGTGKSAFVAFLIKYLRPNQQLAGCYFFKFNEKFTSAGDSFVQSLSYQIGTFFPECCDTIITAYKSLNQSDMSISLEEKLNALVILPLQKVNQANRRINANAVIVIDALDEIGEVGSVERKEVLKVIINLIKMLPSWVKVLITSRPDEDILKLFDKFQSTIINENDNRHETDIKKFITDKIKGRLSNSSDRAAVVDHIYGKSEGRFLNIALILDKSFDNKIEKYSLKQFERMCPLGLDSVYAQHFQNMRALNPGLFDSKMRPLLRILVAMEEPISITDAQSIIGCTSDEINSLADMLGTVFPTVGEFGQKRFTIYHKTTYEWLTTSSKSRKVNADGTFDIFWLRDVLSIPLDDLVKADIMMKLIDAKFNTFESFLNLSDDQWTNKTIPISQSYVNNLKKYFELKTPASFSNHLDYDFYFDINDSHVVFGNGLYGMINNYKPMSTSLTEFNFTFPSQVYILRYTVGHILMAGKIDEAKSLVLHFDWLMESIRLRPHRILDILSDYRKCSKSKSSYDVMLDLDFKLMYQTINMSLSKITNSSNQIDTFVFSLIGHLRSLVLQKKCGVYLQSTVERAIIWWKANKKFFPLLYELNPPGGPLELTITGHSDHIPSVCVTPDGKKIVSGSDDRAIRIWDIETGQCESPLLGHEALVSTVAVTPDGKRIVSGSWDKAIKVWDLSTGTCLNTFVGHSSRVTSLQISLDGKKVVSGSNDKNILVWDLETGICEGTLTGHTGRITSVVISPDNKLVVTGSDDKSICIWHLSTGLCERKLQGHADGVLCVAISPDGKRIVSGSGDESIKIWDVKTGACLHSLYGHSANVASVAITPNGKIVSGAGDNSVRVWELSTGASEGVLSGHTDHVESVAITPDGNKIISGSGDGSIRVWDISLRMFESVNSRHTDYISSISISSDCKKVVTGSYDKTVRIWNLETGECEKCLSGHSEFITSVAVTPDVKKVVSGSKDMSIRVYDITTGSCDKTLLWNRRSVESVYITPDGNKIVAGSDGKGLRVWDLITGTCENALTGHNDGKLSVLFSPDSKYCIVSGPSDDTIRIWDIASGSCEYKLPGHVGGVIMAYLKDNKLIATSGNKSILVWDISNGTKLDTFSSEKLPADLSLADSTSEVLNFAATLGINTKVYSSRDGYVAIGTSDLTVVAFSQLNK